MPAVKVLVLEPPFVSNVGWWRLYRPLQAVKKLFPGTFEFKFKRKDLDYFDAWDADIIITSRPGAGKKPDEQAAVNEFVRLAKRTSGAAFIVDMDDNVLEIPKGHSLYVEYQNRKRRKGIEECLGMANGFWFSTPAFLESISRQGLVVPNAVLPTELPDSPSPENGWAAWRGHSIQQHDLLLEGVKIWPEIRDKAKAWLWMGYYPPIQHGGNSEELPYIDDPERYMDTLRKTPLNVLWKPMIDCRFNEHKSNIALIEATMAGGYCLTNFAGRPMWEKASKKWIPYKAGVVLWEKARQDIADNYNLIDAAIARANHMASLVPHLFPQQNVATE